MLPSFVTSVTEPIVLYRHSIFIVYSKISIYSIWRRRQDETGWWTRRLDGAAGSNVKHGRGAKPAKHSHIHGGSNCLIGGLSSGSTCVQESVRLRQLQRKAERFRSSICLAYLCIPSSPFLFSSLPHHSAYCFTMHSRTRQFTSLQAVE